MRGITDVQKAVRAVAIRVLLAGAREAFVAAAAFAIEIPARPFAASAAALEQTRTDVLLVAGRVDTDQGFADALVTCDAASAKTVRIAVLAHIDLLPAGSVDAFCRAAAKVVVIASLAHPDILPAGPVHAFRRAVAKVVRIAGLAQIDVEGALRNEIEGRDRLAALLDLA